MRVNGSLHDILKNRRVRKMDVFSHADGQSLALGDAWAAGDMNSLGKVSEESVPTVEEPSIEDQDLDFPIALPDVANDGGKLALISVYYGGRDNLRREAHARAFAEWDRQSVKPDDGVFLEMVLPGDEPAFSDGDFPSWINYVRIYGKERNRNIFQKEAMWNLATKFTDAGKLLFLDGDCMPVGCDDYFARIGDACVPGRCVHAAWHVRHEGQSSEDSDYYSCFADRSSVPEGCKIFPGYGYCLTRGDFMRMDGFNPWGIFGFGDCLFVWESMPGFYPMAPFARRMHDCCLRGGRPRLRPVVVDGLEIQHNFHGLKSDRGYVCGNYVVSLFGSPKSYCHVDSAGLVAWNDQEFPLKYMITKRDRMHSVDEMYGMICDVFRERMDSLLMQDQFYDGDKMENGVYD